MRILIADDHHLLRDVLRSYLESEGGFEVETVQDLPDALQRIESAGPWDLVLLDYSMPGMNGYSGLKAAVEANQGSPVAVMSGVAPPDVPQAILAAGGSGYLPKTLTAKSLVNAIRFMAAGEVYLPVEVSQSDHRPFIDDAGLSARELKVLAYLCAGEANKDIARQLNLGEPTVKLHVKVICRKLGAKNRTQAAIMARERKLC